MDRLPKIVAPLALAALLLGVSVQRVVTLSGGEFEPSSVGEERAYAWFYQPSLRAALYAAAARAPAGGALYVVLPDEQMPVSWAIVQMHYHAPATAIAGIGHTPPDSLPPGVVELTLEPTADGASGPSEAAGAPAAFAVSTAALLALGALALRRAGLLAELPGTAALAAALALGTSLAAPMLFGLGRLGMPLAPIPIAASLLAACAALALWPGPQVARGGAARPRRASPVEIGFAALGVAGLALFLWKLVQAPLWSHDHFAVWGLKARRIAAAGTLDLSFLRDPAFDYANPHYPLGVPMAWLVHSLGRMPGTLIFKAAHAAWGLAALSLVAEGARQVGATRGAALAAAAFAVAGPLYWNTEAVGLAEMPLACVALAAVALGLGAARAAPAAGWPAGVCLGFLVWIKDDGLVLAALLAGALVLLQDPAERRARAAWLLGPAIALGAAARLSTRGIEATTNFFQGDWAGRALERLGTAGDIFDTLGEELSHAEWLGLWWALPVAFVAALVLRRRAVWLLLVAVGGQLAAYTGVYFATKLHPYAHILSSFARICAALAPLAIAACAGLVPASPTRAGPREADS